MSHHFTNSHDCRERRSPSLAVAFKDLFGRFRATSMVEEGQTEDRCSRLRSAARRKRAENRKRSPGHHASAVLFACGDPQATPSGPVRDRVAPIRMRLLALCRRVLLHVGEALFSRKNAFVQRAGLSNKMRPVAVAIRPREFHDFAHLISREGNDRRGWRCEYHASPRGTFTGPVSNRKSDSPMF